MHKLPPVSTRRIDSHDVSEAIKAARRAVGGRNAREPWKDEKAIAFLFDD